MRPFDKFKEIDARLAALEAENSELKARLAAIERPKLGYSYGKPFTIDSPGKLRPFFASDDPGELPAKWGEQLAAPIVDAKPIASATIAPPPAKRRGRPPKTA